MVEAIVFSPRLRGEGVFGHGGEHRLDGAGGGLQEPAARVPQEHFLAAAQLLEPLAEFDDCLSNLLVIEHVTDQDQVHIHQHLLAAAVLREKVCSGECNLLPVAAPDTVELTVCPEHCLRRHVDVVGGDGARPGEHRGDGDGAAPAAEVKQPPASGESGVVQQGPGQNLGE